jgi:hypothetical protein
VACQARGKRRQWSVTPLSGPPVPSARTLPEDTQG